MHLRVYETAPGHMRYRLDRSTGLAFVDRKKPLTRKTPLRSKKGLRSKTPLRAQRFGGRGDAPDGADETPCDKALALQKVWALLNGQMIAGRSFEMRALVGPYLCDFVCAGARLVVLLDADEEQCTWLRANGYRVLTFSAAAALQDPERVRTAVTNAFALRIVKS